MTIPKIIFQTWKTQNIPDKWALGPKSIRAMMPTWEYRLLTDEDNLGIVTQYFPNFLPYYQAFKYPIQRADAIRYMVLYLYGGLYLDLDYEMHESLEPYLSSGDLFFISSSNTTSYLTNSLLASRKGHPIWLEMIEEMKKPVPFWAWGKHLEVITSTGPGMVDRVVKRNKDKYPYTLLDQKKINPFNICDIAQDLTHSKSSVLRPLEGGSWIGWDTVIYNNCYCYWPTIISWIIIFLLLFIVFILVINSKRKR